MCEKVHVSETIIQFLLVSLHLSPHTLLHVIASHSSRLDQAHLFYDPVKLDAAYYRGLMALNGWGPGGEYTNNGDNRSDNGQSSSSSSSSSSTSGGKRGERSGEFDQGTFGNHNSEANEGGDGAWSEEREGEDQRPDWALCEASTLLEEAARHTLWLSADIHAGQSLPPSVAGTPPGPSSSSGSSSGSGSGHGDIHELEVPLAHLTSFYGLLQSALISYEQQEDLPGSDLLSPLASASSSSSSSSSSSQQAHPWQQQQPSPSKEEGAPLLQEKDEDEEIAFKLILPEALRRFDFEH